MTNTPFPYTPQSRLIMKFAEELSDQIIDQAYEWAMELPEVAIPIELEDEELDSAIDKVTFQFEEVVYKALASRLGIKI